jgi:hypothetical protein
MSNAEDVLVLNVKSYPAAYGKHHSTETSFPATLDSVYAHCDHSSSALLVALDLSAVFDTILIVRFLISRPETSSGVDSTVLLCHLSCLSDRSFFVAIGNSKSETLKLKCGVPKGSVLGPLPNAYYTFLLLLP